MKCNLHRYTTGSVMHVAKVSRPGFLGVGGYGQVMWV
jgi:hypothetical protein